MAKYKMPFNQYKDVRKMSQKEFSSWIEAFGRESYKQGFEKALEDIPDGSMIIDPNNALVVEMEDDKLKEVLLSVPGVGPKLCDKIIDAIYYAFDEYPTEGEQNES